MALLLRTLDGMEAVGLKEFRTNQAATIKKVEGGEEDAAMPVAILRRGIPIAVLVPVDDFQHYRHLEELLTREVDVPRPILNGRGEVVGQIPVHKGSAGG